MAILAIAVFGILLLYLDAKFACTLTGQKDERRKKW